MCNNTSARNCLYSSCLSFFSFCWTFSYPPRFIPPSPSFPPYFKIKEREQALYIKHLLNFCLDKYLENIILKYNHNNYNYIIIAPLKSNYIPCTINCNNLRKIILKVINSCKFFGLKLCDYQILNNI